MTHTRRQRQTAARHAVRTPRAATTAAHPPEAVQDGNHRRLTARLFRPVVFVLALTGMGISGYLTLAHAAEQPVYCAGVSSCDTVNTSAYAEVAGLPVAAFGLAAYGAIAALTLLSRNWPVALPALLFVAASGTFYSLYLTWVEVAIIDAICLWCLASAALIALITVLTTVQLLRTSPAASNVGGAASAMASRSTRR